VLYSWFFYFYFASRNALVVAPGWVVSLCRCWESSDVTGTEL